MQLDDYLDKYQLVPESRTHATTQRNWIAVPIKCTRSSQHHRPQTGGSQPSPLNEGELPHQWICWDSVERIWKAVTDAHERKRTDPESIYTINTELVEHVKHHGTVSSGTGGRSTLSPQLFTSFPSIFQPRACV